MRVYTIYVTDGNITREYRAEGETVREAKQLVKQKTGFKIKDMYFGGYANSIMFHFKHD